MFGEQRFRSALLAAFMCAGALNGIGSAFAQGDKTPLRVAYTPAVPWLSIWVAKDTGIFERNGLDVTFTQVQNLSLLPATLGKQIDIAPTTPTDIVKTAASGLDVVGITGGTLEVAENRAVELIVRKDSSIKTAQDLKGKLIAAPTIGAIMHVSTLYWLKKNGVDPNSVRAVEVPFPNMGDQLRAGRVDAAEVIQPFAGALMANGGVSIADPILEIADRTMVTLWIAEGNWARSNPATLAKWNASDYPGGQVHQDQAGRGAHDSGEVHQAARCRGAEAAGAGFRHHAHAGQARHLDQGRARAWADFRRS